LSDLPYLQNDRPGRKMISRPWYQTLLNHVSYSLCCMVTQGVLNLRSVYITLEFHGVNRTGMVYISHKAWFTARIEVTGVSSHPKNTFTRSTASRTALGPTQPPIQWVAGALSLGVKRLGREADHSPPSSAEVKEWVELYLNSSNTPSWRGAELKHKDNFTFYTKDSFVAQLPMARQKEIAWPHIHNVVFISNPYWQ
jgi:hypothetical protein